MIRIKKQQNRTRRPSRRSIAIGSSVITDVIREATVVGIIGDQLQLRYSIPNWPFPVAEEYRNKNDIEVLDIIPEYADPEYEEAPF